jgi:ABC-type transport system involved in multi-copper enzyme maturation permease subunit
VSYFAILVDSWIEALDKKSLYVMFIVSAVFILLLASISYSPMDATETLQDLTGPFSMVMSADGRGVWSRHYPDAKFAVEDVKELGADAGSYAGGYGLTLKVAGIAEFHRLVRHWDAAERRVVKKSGDEVPDHAAPADADLEVKFVRAKFREQMIPRVEVTPAPAGSEERAYAVRIKPASRQLLAGAFRMNIAFGAWSFKLPFSVAMTVFVIEKLLSEYLAGLVGVLIALVITAWSVPNMLQKGAVDVLLAKPIGRSAYLFFKYLGGLTYASITSIVFIGGSWLVLSARSGVWNWGFLYTAATLVLFFAVLYSIGVFAAVLTRGVIAAIAAPIVAWAAGSALNAIKNVLENPMLQWRVPSWVGGTLEGLSWLLPRAGDINRVNDYFMMSGSLGPDVMQLVAERGVPDVPWVRILASSGALIVVMMSLSCWIFSRRDP